MDEIKTVVCVNNGDSYKYSKYYLNKVKDIINDADEVIFWGSNVKEMDGDIAAENDATDRSHPQEFINTIKNYYFKYILIITVVGYMDDEDIQICDKIIKQSNILDNIVNFKIYYFVEKERINMQFDGLFTSKKFKKEVFVNGYLWYHIDINIDFDKLTLSDISPDFKYNIISLVNKFPEDKIELRWKLGELFNRLSRRYQKKKSLRLFSENNDVEGCMRFIERGLYNFNVKILQQKIRELLNLFDNPVYDYVLSDSINVLLKPEVQCVLDEDSETDEDSITCDITFNKCKQLCLLVRDTRKYKIPGEIGKQMFQNPFLILKHRDLVEKMLNLVEYNQIDITSYSKLKNKNISPFTRQPMTGIYIFNSDSELMDWDVVMENNNIILSMICRIDCILSKCSGLWHLVFLYMLMKFHPKWKNEPEIIKKEIKYICDRTITPISLFPNLEPDIQDQLSIGLWYVVNVSHKLYPNSRNNVLRNMGESSTYFLDFYSDIFHSVDEELYNKTKLWTVWSYMVRNQGNSRKFLSEILAQYQKYREIEGSLIFFSGQCEKRYESILNILPVEKVLGLYHILHENSREFDEIEHVQDRNPQVDFINTSEPSCREHVVISLRTCQAVTVCSNTYKQRKKCGVDYIRYFDIFHEFCVVNGEYPKNEYDLITNHSWEHYKTSSQIVVYPVQGLEHFRLVMEKFEKVTKKYAVKDYLKISTDCELELKEYNEFESVHLKHCFIKRPYCVSSINRRGLTSTD
ncbi:uncharacterized protein [Leptinotarsa decemlineata]|uniref:uncharacterized protein n=1 Tax=Leptinotarsa decemlineata TaxID=7539 RepID=UPI003D305A37